MSYYTVPRFSSQFCYNIAVSRPWLLETLEMMLAMVSIMVPPKRCFTFSLFLKTMNIGISSSDQYILLLIDIHLGDLLGALIVSSLSPFSIGAMLIHGCLVEQPVHCRLGWLCPCVGLIVPNQLNILCPLLGVKA